MGEILGLGITHQPTLAMSELRPVALWKALADPRLPDAYRNGDAWPERFRSEFGDDRGLAACAAHRDVIVAELARARTALDDFRPDLVLVWGDDQYENFREDCVPAFCVFAAEQFELQLPQYPGQANVWNDPADSRTTLGGHRAGAMHLATALLEDDFDIAYSYRPLHHPLGHAFAHSVLYLDWDRRGFSYPIVPFSVNCFGRRTIVDHGGITPLRDPEAPLVLDPPSPSPRRCFALGAAVARAFAASPWRVALVASSSWSHAFLTDKTYKLLPDLEADRTLFDALRTGDYGVWSSRTLSEVESSGQYEMLNWFCLVGAMAELGRTPAHAVMIESMVANSNKVIAVFPPVSAAEPR
jgi:hypothetical protein